MKSTTHLAWTLKRIMMKKYALVTGASSGVGYSTTMELLSHGYIVFATVRKEQDAEKLRSEKIIPLLLDVTSDSQLREAYKKIESICGENGLHALINNAGESYVSPFELSEEKMARKIMEVNFFGPYKIMQRFLPLLKRSTSRNGSGKIININSVGGLQGIPWLSFYSASKFALIGLSESVRLELRQFNIHVTSLVLGAVKTSMTSKNEASAQEALDLLPSEFSPYYRKGLMGIKDAGKQSESFASDPKEIAKKIAKILSGKKIRFQYVVGGSATFMRFLIRYFPASWRHSLLKKNMGL